MIRLFVVFYVFRRKEQYKSLLFDRRRRISPWIWPKLTVLSASRETSLAAHELLRTSRLTLAMIVRLNIVLSYLINNNYSTRITHCR
jgi:hypothetical protein